MSDKREQKVEINVIILSDRLIERAKELADYICSGTDNIKVLGTVANSKEVMRIAKNQSIDFLIIAGYLSNESSYNVIEELYNQQKNCIPVSWSIPDSLILSICRKHSISLIGAILNMRRMY